jgi:hypothetical protein
MTDTQITTAKQIVKEYYDLFEEKPIIVNMEDREIILNINSPILHPHYKALENGKILFGIGTEYTEYDMLVIGINNWKIIKPNGDILDAASYSDLEKELTQDAAEISAYSSREDLIRF